MKSRDKERAKAIIVEIIRQADGTFRNKTNLFKAFWLAHVKYAESHVSPLSDWPIVKLPKGPGIHDFDLLLGELMESGTIETVEVQLNDVSGFHFHLRDHETDPLAGDALSAVQFAVSQFHGIPATEASRISHEDSRAWNSVRIGDEMDVVLDTISDEEFDRISARVTQFSDALDEVLGCSTDTSRVPN